MQTEDFESDISLRAILQQILAGVPRTLGITCVTIAASLVAAWLVYTVSPLETRMRVAFSFQGFDKGEYPDGSKFQPDDLRAPDLIDYAEKRLRFSVDDNRVRSLRTSIYVSPIIPPNLAKERDRLRNSGQTVPPFVADEYELTLVPPLGSRASTKEREMFLGEVVNGFNIRFNELFSQTPVEFGAVFQTLKNGDYFEYDIALNQEMQNLRTLLTSMQEKAKNFRSPTTKLTFHDLLSQLHLFSQLKLTETLATINSIGLTTNRTSALLKINYYINVLNDDEQRLSDEEKTINELLSKAQQRGQSYLLSSKVQTEATRPIVSENLLDTLVANDTYNFLIKKALDVGNRVQSVRSRHNQAIAIREKLQAFVEHDPAERETLSKQVESSMSALEKDYGTLIGNIRQTYSDYTRQQYSDSIRVTMQPHTESGVRLFLLYSAVGATIGLLTGAGLSLISKTLVNPTPR